MNPIPPIFVRIPVTSPLELQGTADVFEAQFCIDVTVDNKVIQHHTVMASSGTGLRGNWKHTLDLAKGKCIIVLYDVSMKDGSQIDVVRIPLLVK